MTGSISHIPHPAVKLEFGTSRRIIFGRGEFKKLAPLPAEYGQRAMIITGRSAAREGGSLDGAIGMLKPTGMTLATMSAGGEPTICGVDELTAEARGFRPQVIIAIGGGSVIDAAKAVAAMLTNTAGPEESVRDFLEGVGTGRKIEHPSLPVIAIPTTSGTGAEVTKNAVIRSDDRSFKKSLRSPFMRPEIAIVDPELTVTSPLDVTSACGMDAMTQLLEAYVSKNASVMTDGMAHDGLEMVFWALERAFLDSRDMAAREAMSLASLLSGIALDNAGLGAVHGLASPIGGFFDIPHGVVCANLLPEIIAANLHAAHQHTRHDEAALRAVMRYRQVAVMLNGGFDCEAEALVEFLKSQRRSLQIQDFGHFGITRRDIPKIVANCRGGSMKTNPIVLDDIDIENALMAAIPEEIPD